jgi:hypothetical protein
MTSDELAAYLAGAGLGLTLGTDLFSSPFPAASTVTVPDLAVAVVDTPGEDPIGSFGESLSPADVERPEVMVFVRGGRDAVEAAKAKAYAVWKKLRRLGDVEISGTRYLAVVAKAPYLLGYDESKRPVYTIVCDVWKEESAA